MKTRSALGFAVVAAMISTSLNAARGFGQEPVEPAAKAASPSDGSWYRTPTPRAEKPSIARQKAVQRGEQRMARLDAMRWYGMSNSRPTAATMPYTTMYSPAWQMPGGRPFAWYASSRPVVIYTNPAVYR